MIIEAIVVGLAATAAYKASQRKKALTPKHEMVLKSALNDDLKPAQFRDIG